MNIATEWSCVKYLLAPLAFLCYAISMDIIAHRGMSGTYPENTMLAFRKAYEAGADGIELDVHLSKDGEVMIMHDESLERTTGVGKLLAECTRAELEKTNAGKTKDDSFGFTPIPSLEEYLFWVKDTGLYTNIELKTAPLYYPGIEEKTIALINKYSLGDRIIFSSFNWLSVMRARMLAPEIPSGFLIDSPRIFNIGNLIHSMGLEYYHPSFRLLSDGAMKELKANHCGVNVWTVNEEDEIRVCMAWQVDGLITNYPERAKAIRNEA